MKYEIKVVHGEIEFLVKVGKNTFVEQQTNEKEFIDKFGNEVAKKSADILGKDNINAKAYPICFNDTYFFKGEIFDAIKSRKKEAND